MALAEDGKERSVRWAFNQAVIRSNYWLLIWQTTIPWPELYSYTHRIQRLTPSLKAQKRNSARARCTRWGINFFLHVRVRFPHFVDWMPPGAVDRQVS